MAASPTTTCSRLARNSTGEEQWSAYLEFDCVHHGFMLRQVRIFAHSRLGCGTLTLWA